MVELYEHQKLGKNYLLENKKACLFFEVGTGKTYTALSALSELPKKSKVLIIAPKKVLYHVWLKQTEYDLSDWDVSYVNYEKLARDKSYSKKRYDCLILDEAHKIKGKTTNTSKIIMQMAKHATWVWGLTGTPVANSYVDVYHIYKHMDICEFSETYNQFVGKYYIFRPLERGIYSIPILIAPKSNMLKNLIDRIDRHSLTKRAEDCITLPERRINIHKIPDMNSPDYKKIESGIFDLAGERRTMIKLEAINKAHQAANGYVYDMWSSTVHIKNNKKLEVLYDLCEMYLEETNKIIVVYQYKEDLTQIKTTLGLEFKVTLNVDEFTSSDAQILCLQCGQAEGLNLQFCNRMIFYTFDYSFLKYEQMCGRIYRSGQTKNVVYDVLIAENTIEEKIWWAVQHKQSTDEFLKGALTKDDR